MTDPTPAPVADHTPAPTPAPSPAPVTDAVSSAAPAPAPAPSAAPAPVGDPSAPVPTPTPTPTPTPAPVADDWRTREANGDAKKLKMLERYQSETAWKESWFELRKTVDTTRPKSALPDKATPEQLAAYRAENGIPDAPEKYLENLPDGLVIGEQDAPIFKDFAETLLAKNLPPAAAHAAIEWYNNWQEKMEAAAAEADLVNGTRTEDILRQEWGNDYRVNVNLRKSFLDSAPEKVRDAFERAKLPDGTLLGQYPDMSRWLVGMAREINPVATIPPGSSVGAGKSIDDRLSEIKPMMGNRNSPYWKGELGADGKTSLEREYGQLLDVQIANQKRGISA